MTTNPDMPAPPQKPKRRWGMIILSAVLAFLLIGIIIAIVAGIDPVTSPASVAPADNLPRVTTMPLEKRQMERRLAIAGTLMARDEISIGTALQAQRPFWASAPAPPSAVPWRSR